MAKEDIFSKAAKDAILKNPTFISEDEDIDSIKAEIVKAKLEVVEDIETEEVVESGVDLINEMSALEKLNVNMLGKHAARFDRTLSALPDREFVPAYLKSLEYFAPKLIRKNGGSSGVVDNTVKIEFIESAEDLDKLKEG